MSREASSPCNVLVSCNGPKLTDASLDGALDVLAAEAAEDIDVAA